MAALVYSPSRLARPAARGTCAHTHTRAPPASALRGRGCCFRYKHTPEADAKLGFVAPDDHDPQTAPKTRKDRMHELENAGSNPLA